MALNDGVDIAGTVRERAARELRDRILTGALPAGTRLDLDAITKEFATSRTPVREALLELSYDGLVRVAPRSGITVSSVTDSRRPLHLMADEPIGSPVKDVLS